MQNDHNMRAQRMLSVARAVLFSCTEEEAKLIHTELFNVLVSATVSNRNVPREEATAIVHAMVATLYMQPR